MVTEKILKLFKNNIINEAGQIRTNEGPSIGEPSSGRVHAKPYGDGEYKLPPKDLIGEFSNEDKRADRINHNADEAYDFLDRAIKSGDVKAIKKNLDKFISAKKKEGGNLLPAEKKLIAMANNSLQNKEKDL